MLILGCLGLALANLHGHTLILKNGDEVAGEYLHTTEGIVYFDSHSFGNLQIGREAVAAVEGVDEDTWKASEEPVLPDIPDVAAIPGSPETIAAEREDEATGRGATAVILNLVDRINPFRHWSSKATLGYVWIGAENRRQDWLLLYEAHRKGEAMEFKFAGRWDYATSKIGETESKKEQDRYRVMLQIRQNLSPRVFAQSRTHYVKDLIRKINHELDQSVGLGWRLVERDRVSLSFVPSATVRYVEVNGFSEGWESRITFFQDFEWILSPRVAFREEFAMSFEPHNSGDSDYELILMLENRISERLSLDLRYEYYFEYGVGVGIERKTQKFITSVGYLF